MQTTVGQLLINNALPPELRDYSRPLDKRGLQALLTRIYTERPKEYARIVQALNDAGQELATADGGSVSLDDLMLPPELEEDREHVRRRVEQILDTAGRDREKRVVEFLATNQPAIEKKVYDQLAHADNEFANQARSGARGTPTSIRSLLYGDLLVADHRDRLIPVAILNSYADGLDPAEYWAASYGARKGLADTKFMVADAGAWAKQTAQAAHQVVVTGGRPRPGTGLSVDVDDRELPGYVLAAPAGGHRAGTMISPSIHRELKRQGVKQVLVHSPIEALDADGGGLPQVGAGLRERGRLPDPGENVGILAAQALAEKLSQSTLCLAAGTLVRMADWSVRPIEEIKAGEYVMGSDKDGVISPCLVTRTFNNGLRECVRSTFRVSTSSEYVELVSTADHKILSIKKFWGPKKNVEMHGVFPVNSKCIRFMAKMPTAVEFNAGRHEPYALMLGILLGDGCYTTSVSGIHWSCNEPDLVDAVRPYFESFGLKVVKLDGHQCYHRISQINPALPRDKKTGRRLPGICTNPIKNRLIELGMYGKYSYEKRIPECVWEWDQPSTAALLAGLFVTDGSVYINKQQQQENACHIAYGSTSLQLVQQIRDILRIRFAIWAGPISQNQIGRKRTLYQITITRWPDIRRFAARIPIWGRKRDVLNRCLASRFLKKRKADTNTLHRTGVSKSNAQTVGDLVPVGLQPTFDLEVANCDHLFLLANGLIVSNSSKHSSGTIGSSKRTVGGFELINNLIQVPKTFRGAAPVAHVDGRISHVDPAEQGGTYVYVEGTRHYVPPDQQMLVKPGDLVEAGDRLTDGIPNPADVVRFKGIGEGRRQFATYFKQAFEDSGLPAHRRNVEVLARGLINHVRINEDEADGIAGFLPHDVVEYDALAAAYTPREGSKRLAPNLATGKYLEEPTLHYSIGTKVSRSVVDHLMANKVPDVHVNDRPPPFHPEMRRALDVLSVSPDPLVRFGGSYQQKGLLESVHRGRSSSTPSKSPIPAMVVGSL